MSGEQKEDAHSPWSARPRLTPPGSNRSRASLARNQNATRCWQDRKPQLLWETAWFFRCFNGTPTRPGKPTPRRTRDRLHREMRPRHLSWPKHLDTCRQTDGRHCAKNQD